MMEQGELKEIVDGITKTSKRLRLKVGKDIVSYRRFNEGRPNKIFLTDEETGRRVATIFAGRRVAEYIVMCVNSWS